MDIEKEREAFLAHMRSISSAGFMFELDEYGNFDDVSMAYAWSAWQAAKDESHKQAALYQSEINHLAQANQQWREKAAKAQAVPEWISVEDKLPSDDIGRVLAWVVEQNSLGKCGFAWNCSHSNGVFSDKFETFQVTHWMPLPALPAQGESHE